MRILVVKYIYFSRRADWLLPGQPVCADPGPQPLCPLLQLLIPGSQARTRCAASTGGVEAPHGFYCTSSIVLYTHRETAYVA